MAGCRKDVFVIHTIRVSSTNKEADSKGAGIKKGLNNYKGTVRCVRAYSLEGITKKESEIIATTLLSEKLVQIYSIDLPLFSQGCVLEIAYKPGVMNPEVASIIKAARDMGINLLAADSSTQYVFSENITKDELSKIAEKLKLYNPTIEHIVEIRPETLLIKGIAGVTQVIPLRTMNDEELINLSKDKLFLNLSEMKVIRDYYLSQKKDPTDCELETIAQTWSEHCAHKTFKANLIVEGIRKTPLIKRLQKTSKKYKKLTVSSFVDNSGVMEFYDGMSICGKVETHNSPSAIEPYGGAATGSGGVFRDILGTGLGAKTVASTDIFCFAYPKTSASLIPTGCLHPEYLLKRVVTGVKDYGNRMGIPTNNGSVHFDFDFRAKPTVLVGGYGILKTKKAQKGKPHVGDRVVVIGGKTGRDGIHGATFSSAEMTDKTVSVNSSAVQIGNAIEEKRMFDAILEASSLGLMSMLQDCGAGGFSSAIGEMGEEIGVEVDLSLAPLKYQGLAPWEIWVSESQERMAASVSQKNLKKFLDTCRKYNVEATVLGKFTGKKKVVIKYDRKIVCDLDVEFLYHGLPRRTMIAEKTTLKKEKKTPSWHHDITDICRKIVSNENVASKEPIVRLYDHTVQGTNVMQQYVGEKLDGPTDAAVIRPMLHKNYGMVLSHGLNPTLNKKDPYWGSVWAGIEALSNYVAVGGNYKEASLINNYSWPFPDEESLWDLDQSVDAVIKLMDTFRIPVISGKDSLSSTYRGKDGDVIKIPPVLCISVFGRILDVAKTVSSDFKKSNSALCLVGTQDKGALGGSILSHVTVQNGGRVPECDLKKLPSLFNTIYKNIQKGKLLSVHDVSEGGMLTAVFEMCAGGGVGAVIKHAGKTDIFDFLFNETAGVFLVEVKDAETAKKIFKDVPYKIIGKTTQENKLIINDGEKSLVNIEIKLLKEEWKKPFSQIFT